MVNLSRNRLPRPATRVDGNVDNQRPVVHISTATTATSMSPALPLGGHLYLGQKGTFLLCVDRNFSLSVHADAECSPVPNAQSPSPERTGSGRMNWVVKLGRYDALHCVVSRRKRPHSFTPPQPLPACGEGLSWSSVHVPPPRFGDA